MLKPLLVHHDRGYCRRVPRSQRWRHASYKVSQAIRRRVRHARPQWIPPTGVYKEVIQGGGEVLGPQ